MLDDIYMLLYWKFIEDYEGHFVDEYEGQNKLIREANKFAIANVQARWRYLHDRARLSEKNN